MNHDRLKQQQQNLMSHRYLKLSFSILLCLLSFYRAYSISRIPFVSISCYFIIYLSLFSLSLRSSLHLQQNSPDLLLLPLCVRACLSACLSVCLSFSHPPPPPPNPASVSPHGFFPASISFLREVLQPHPVLCLHLFQPGIMSHLQLA